VFGRARNFGAIRKGLVVALAAVIVAIGFVPAYAVAPIGSSNFLKQIQTQNLSGILGTTSTNNLASSISLNGFAYFIGSAPETGSELYTSDGTPAGTNIVKDAVPGIQGSVQNLVLSHGKLFFTSGDSISSGNLEPWVSDGTAAGTFKIKDIAPGSGGSSAYSFTQGPNGLTYFLADDATTSLAANGSSVYNGVAIWATDGTTAGTYKVKDVNTYSYGPSSTYYYPAQSSISGMTSCGGKLFFSASDDNYNSWNELWVSDGTEAGTQEVKDINLVSATISLGMYSPSLNSTIAPGTVTTGGSAPQNFVCLNDIVYFSADDGYGRTLWRSDGTLAGTYMVRPPSDTNYPDNPQKITVLGNKLVMSAFTFNYGPNLLNLGHELWISDGTSAGTQMIKDINATPSTGSSPDNFTLYNGQLYFTALDSRGVELWKTDGTTVGTLFVKDINMTGSGTSSSPRNFYVWNNKLFFTANDGINGEEVWASAGTGATTNLVKDVFAGVSDVIDTSYNAANRPYFAGSSNGLLFVANSPVYGQEMWTTDGTEANTQLLKDLNTLPGSAYAHDAIAFNGKIYFSAASAEYGQELWSTDLTTGNTVQVVDIWPGASSGFDSTASYFTIFDGRLYFTARSPTSGWELWSTDGTAQGTSQATELYASAASASQGPSHMAVCNGKLYFNQLGNGPYGQISTLFSFNGSSATQIFNRTLNAKFTVCLNNVLYFNAQNYVTSSRDYELWKSDGTLAGTSVLFDAYPGTCSASQGCSSNPSNLTIYSNKLYFTASNNTAVTGTGNELYVTDGTTTSIIEIVAGLGSSAPSYLRNFNGELWFRATTSTYGTDWVSYDGTALNFRDLTPGAAATVIDANVVVAGGRLWYRGFSANEGYELHSTDGTSSNSGIFEDLSPGVANTTMAFVTGVGGSIMYNTYDTVMGSQPRFVIATSTSTVSFNANGATSGTVPSDITVMSVSATIPGNSGAMVRTGYDFVGWNTNAIGTGVTYLPGSTITPVVDTPLYAKWASVNSYTITYNANGATSGVVAPPVTGANSIFDLDTNSGALARTGYTFAGWNTLANGSGTNYTAGSRYTPTASVTLYAKWTALTPYTIAFNLNGAAGSAPATINTYATAVVVLPGEGSMTAPASTTFAGWNTNAAGTGSAYAAAETYSPQSSITLYAQWTNVTQATLTYDANGSTSGTVPAALTAAGTYVVIDSNTGILRKTGFVFSGWNTAADGSGTTYQGTDNYLLSANVTLYAFWVAASYSVTFASNQSTGGTVPAAITGVSVSTTLPSNTGNLVRAGYTFAGWNTLASGLGADYAAGGAYSPTSNTVLYAKWTALPTYIITYSGNGATGGGVPVAQTGVYASVNIDNNSGLLVRSGFYFAGWNSQADGLGATYAAGSSYTPIANITLYALWSNVATYSLSYNSNSSTSGTSPLVQSGITSSATVSSNTGSLSRLGYRFDGWNTLANGSGTTYSAGATITLSADTTLFALWTSVPTYTITFSGNAQTSGSIPSAVTSSDANVNLPGNTGVLNKTNFTFNGWNTQADGLGTHFDVGASFSLSANTTLYAEWLGNIYTLTYNSNGATSGSIPSPSSGRGAVTTSTNSGALAKTGFNFDGWNTAGDGTGASISAGASYTPTANTTLFAKWTAIPTYTVIFNANGATSGSAPASIAGILTTTVLPGNTGAMALASRVFGGWNTLANGAGTNYSAGSTFTATANGTLYATWNVNYSIAYDGNGATSGNAPATQTGLAGAATVASNTGSLSKSGFSFGGWNTLANGSGTTYAAGAAISSSSDVLLYAVWSVLPTFTITYDDNGATTGTAAISVQSISASTVLDNNSGSMTKTGYVFAGWNTQADGLGTSYAAGSSYTPTANVTLYALWTTNAPAQFAPRFEITKIAKRQFNLDGGVQTVFGKNLDIVTYVSLDGQTLKIITSTDSSLTFAITAHTAGWADLVMKGDGAVLTFNKFVQFVGSKALTFTNFFANGVAKITDAQIAKLALEIIRAREYKIVQLGFANNSQGTSVISRTITLKENMALVKLAMQLMKRLPKTVDVSLRLTGNTKDLTLTFNNN
jgi:uncharacterized repeat protein (TIGR02543 family)